MNNSPLAAAGISILMLVLVILPGMIFRACDSQQKTGLPKQKPPCPCEVYTENWQKHNDSVLNRLKPGQKIRLVPQGTGETGYIYITRFVDRDSCVGTVTERIEVDLK